MRLLNCKVEGMDGDVPTAGSDRGSSKRYPFQGTLRWSPVADERVTSTFSLCPSRNTIFSAERNRSARAAMKSQRPRLL